jgi:hypothetical protein
MIELLLPCGFITHEYSWVKAIIGICMLVDYSMAKKCQQAFWRSCWGSQLILSICRVNRIQLVNTISLCRYLLLCSVCGLNRDVLDLIIQQSTTPSDYWSTFGEPVPLGMISCF